MDIPEGNVEGMYPTVGKGNIIDSKVPTGRGYVIVPLGVLFGDNFISSIELSFWLLKHFKGPKFAW